MAQVTSGPDGRLFCVTGYQCPVQQREHSGQQLTSGCTNLKNAATDSTQLIGQSDTESITSGYISSSSSFESSAEERRLGLNEHRALHLWTKWSEQIEIPKQSTPKQADNVRSRKCISVCIGSENSSQAVKLKINLKPKSRSESSEDKVCDSFWDIQSLKMLKCGSEGNIHNGRNTCADLQNGKCNNSNHPWQCHPVTLMHDAGLTIGSEKTHIHKIQDTERKPSQSEQNSLDDIRQFVRQRPKSVACEQSDFAIYYGLPRYRKKVECDNELSHAKSLVKQLNERCADVSEVGIPVDESMSEFLSNVDKDNLTGFLHFYDNVRNEYTYERARRNPKNHEAVYY